MSKLNVKTSRVCADITTERPQPFRSRLLAFRHLYWPTHHIYFYIYFQFHIMIVFSKNIQDKALYFSLVNDMGKDFSCFGI